MRAKDIRKKISKNIKRKRRIRAKIFGTSELPRVSVFVSNRHIYAQAINDTEGRTLASCDGSKLGVKANKEGAKQLAASFAETLKTPLQQREEKIQSEEKALSSRVALLEKDDENGSMALEIHEKMKKLDLLCTDIKGDAYGIS